MFCPQCGSKLANEDRCPDCGPLQRVAVKQGTTSAGIRRFFLGCLVGSGIIVLAIVALAGWGYYQLLDHRTYMDYSAVQVTSAKGNGEFDHLAVVEPAPWNRVSLEQVPDFYLRLDGNTILFAPDLTEEVAAEHYERFDPGGTPNDIDGVLYLKKHRDADGTYKGYNVSTLRYYNEGKVTFTFGHDRVQEPGLEFGKDADGPFYSLPLSREQVIELFGPPLREGKFRDKPRPKWRPG